MSIAERIKSLRVRKGFTQKQLSDVADVPQKNISMYENGTIPSADALKRIAIALEVDANYLLDIVSSKKLEHPLMNMMREIDNLKEPEKTSLLTLIESFLQSTRVPKDKRK